MQRVRLISYLCTYLIILLIIYLYRASFLPISDLAVALILHASYFVLKDLSFISKHTSIKDSLSKYHIYIIWLIYFSLTFYFPYLYLFIACVYLDIDSRNSDFLPCLLITFLGGAFHYPLEISLLITLLSYLLALIFWQTTHIQEEEAKSFAQINHLRWLNSQLKQRQNQLLELQDDIEGQTIASERRRITKEIHDLLGHQLSATIIQLEALEMIATDQTMANKLKEINQTLQDSMTNVRSVIHAQHAQAIDLDFELKHLLQDYSDYQIHYHYQVSSPLKSQISHHLLAISRESLTNIRKHAHASQIHLFIREINQQLTYLITDNGQGLVKHQKVTNGIGLINIEERVEQMKGQLYVTAEEGFRIFISIPIGKEQQAHENLTR